MAELPEQQSAGHSYRPDPASTPPPCIPAITHHAYAKYRERVRSTAADCEIEEAVIQAFTTARVPALHRCNKDKRQSRRQHRQAATYYEGSDGTIFVFQREDGQFRCVTVWDKAGYPDNPKRNYRNGKQQPRF